MQTVSYSTMEGNEHFKSNDCKFVVASVNVHRSHYKTNANLFTLFNHALIFIWSFLTISLRRLWVLTASATQSHDASTNA